MDVETIFFDLDSTLYPEKNGLWQAIRGRIDLYMLEVMGFSAGEISGIRQKFLSEHGTTLKGLQTHFKIDQADYLTFVHDLPLQDYLDPDPILRDLLLSIPRRRWIFTNADADHANRVTGILGITDCFEGMIDVWKLEPYCKPQEASFSRALDLIGGTASHRCALLDDSPNNLEVAKQMGFFTALVGRNINSQKADRFMESIHDLRKVVPEFWS